MRLSARKQPAHGAIAAPLLGAWLVNPSSPSPHPAAPQMRAVILAKLESLRDTPNREEVPILYHLDVAAM